MKTIAKNTRGLGRERLMDLFPTPHIFLYHAHPIFFLDLGRFPFTKNFEKLPWRGRSSEERVPFDTSSIFSSSRHQNLR